MPPTSRVQSGGALEFIAEAEYWEKLDELELAVYYEECNSSRTEDVDTSAGSAKSGSETIVAD